MPLVYSFGFFTLFLLPFSFIIFCPNYAEKNQSAFFSDFFVAFTKSDWWKLISVYNFLASYWLVFLHHLNLKRGRFITSTATYSHLGFEIVKARVVDGLCIKDKED